MYLKLLVVFVCLVFTRKIFYMWCELQAAQESNGSRCFLVEDKADDDIQTVVIGDGKVKLSYVYTFIISIAAVCPH